MKPKRILLIIDAPGAYMQRLRLSITCGGETHERL